MIKVEKLTKHFESDSPILNNISFDINKGETIAIIGQSGVGKSVLLKHLNGLIKPDDGKVWVDNTQINNIPFNELQNIRRKMAMVFQFGALFDSMTINENILLAIKNLTRLKKSQYLDRINNSLNMVDLDNIGDLMPSEISGGMKKRVGIARAIAINPEYILYDEPTTGLDPITSDKINKLIKKVSKNRKVTSIVVTHDMKTLKEVVNRVIMLYKGSVIFDGDIDLLFKSKDKYIQYFVTGEKK